MGSSGKGGGERGAKSQVVETDEPKRHRARASGLCRKSAIIAASSRTMQQPTSCESRTRNCIVREGLMGEGKGGGRGMKREDAEHKKWGGGRECNPHTIPRWNLG